MSFPVTLQRIAGIAAALGALSSVAPQSVPAADFSSGGTFLGLGHGARAHALGGVGVARLRGDEAVYWNPANLAWSDAGLQITFMHATLLPGVDDGYQTVSLGRGAGSRLGEDDQALRPRRWGYGVFFSHFGFDFASGAGWSENVLQIGAGVAINNYATAGASLKLLRVDNDFENGDATGAGVDVGVNMLLWEPVTLAVVARDLVTQVTWDTDRNETLPPAVIVGLEYRWRDAVAVELDVALREGAAQRTALGAEWRAWREALWIRAGLTTIAAGLTRTYPSTGVGIVLDRFQLDYAAAFDDAEALDTQQRVSLHVTF